MDLIRSRPIGITLGDPTGIGPELVVRLLAEGLQPAGAPALEGPPLRVYGDPDLLAETARRLGRPWPPGAVEIVAVTRLPAADQEPGQPTPGSGAAQVAYVEAALADAARGALAGLCTAPIHKASAIAAGLRFPGHTELLAERLGQDPDDVVMMLAGPSLRVALCTNHLALAAVPAALSIRRIQAVVRTTALSLHRDLGIRSPLLLCAGLNPHAGEGGHFGDEEERLIRPALEAARRLPELVAIPGLVIDGPGVPDVVFRRAVYPLAPDGRRADAVVAMYHDQGLIPLKLLDFDEGVNVTLGLPVPRTSPDHGVAHDIAGTGRARVTSMAAALRLCREIVLNRNALTVRQSVPV